MSVRQLGKNNAVTRYIRKYIYLNSLYIMIKCESKYKYPHAFIVGSGRSGTTLLTSILNASEQIYIPYESDFVARAYPFYKDKSQFNVEDYKRLFKIFRLSAKEDGWGMSENHFVSHLSERSPQTFADVTATICEAFHELEGTKNLLWGIKAPVLIASLERIRDVFPQARIIHVVRDGRDVYLSYKNVHESNGIKFGPKGVIANALYWIDGLRRVEEFIQSNSNHQVYELQYDSFISSPTPILKQLCEFLKIDYRPSMEDNFSTLERNKKVAPSYFRKNIHKKIQKKLDAGNTKKYLTKMKKIDLIKFELIATPYLVKYGYQPEYPIFNSFFFSPIRTILYFLARLFNNVRYDKRDRTIYEKTK